jgi:hypothetical protein
MYVRDFPEFDFPDWIKCELFQVKRPSFDILFRRFKFLSLLTFDGINLAAVRIIAQISHPQIRIAIMSYNDKYIIEMEAGQYKQTYKISHDSVSGLEEVKALCTDQLIANTLERFRQMHADFSEAFRITTAK